MPVRIRLFGAPRIEMDGELVGYNRTRGLALLAYLAVSAAPVTRDTLLGLLWPDFAQADARNGLRRELSLLRSLLGNEAIHADRTLISLSANPDFVWSDVGELRRLIERVQDHGEAPGDPCPQCVADLESAADLYSGNFLAGFALPDSPAFDEWQLLQTERLRNSFATVLEQLVSWYVAQHEYEPALSHARRQLALDTGNESASRQLMRVLAWAGQPSAAVREYERLRLELQAEYGLEPDPATNELYEQIRGRRIGLPPEPAGRPDSPTPAPAVRPVTTQNLPADTTPFVGRERELSQLADMIADPAVRLISIIGPGGMGKTRLATAAARKVASMTHSGLAYPDGVFFAALAPLSSPAEIVPTLARILGFSFEGQEEQERQLVDFLRPKRALLVLDNYEHLLDEHSASLPARVLEGAPDVSIIVTSRARLGSRSEYVFALGGFDLADLSPMSREISRDNGDAWEHLRLHPALALFANVARRLDSQFEITAENVANIGRIAQLVGGMPLGIELAAGWLEMYSPAEIAHEISASLDFLESDWVDLPERQTSLKAVFDTSWRILSEEERRIVAELSIFRGGFERSAAETVVGAHSRTLQALVNKSWLQRVGGQRFQIHELLRQYAEEQLGRDTGDYESVQSHHAAYYADYVAALAARIKGAEPSSALNSFAADLENIMAAWQWLVQHDQHRQAVQMMLPGLYLYCEARFDYRTLAAATDSAFAFMPTGTPPTDEEADLRFALLAARSAFFDDGWPERFMSYDYVAPEYKQRLQETWSLLNVATPESFWLVLSAFLVGLYLDYQEGTRRLHECLEQLSPADDAWLLNLARQLLGRLTSYTGPQSAIFAWRGLADDPELSEDEPLRLLEQALAGFRQLGSVREESFTLIAIGFHHQNSGRMAAAKSSLEEAHAILLALGESLTRATVVAELGHLAMRTGDFDEAFRCLRDAANIFLEQGRLRLANGTLSAESYEALRYSTPEHALETRKQALSLSLTTGHHWEHGWDLWEMGEIYRFMGDFAAARAWYERALPVFAGGIDHNGLTFYDRGLGDIALAEGDFQEAYRRFEASLQRATETDHLWSINYALRGLADAAMGLGEFATARQHLVEALQAAYERQTAPGDPGGMFLAVFAAAARFFHAMHQEPEARDLACYVLKNRLTWNETRRDLERLPWVGDCARPGPGEPDPLSEYMSKSLALMSQLEALDIAD